jgi:oxalate---CoA ligase
MWRRIREEGDKSNDAPIIKSGEQAAETKESLDFSPIDAFHLSDLNILRNRITKLLLNSPNHTHVAKDLVITLVSFLSFAFLQRIHRTEGIQKPDQNGTPFF